MPTGFSGRQWPGNRDPVPDRVIQNTSRSGT